MGSSFPLAVLLGVAAWGDDAEVREDEPIVIEGDGPVERARRAVIDELQELGYDRRVRRDSVTILRHGQPWRGQVSLHDDGWIEMGRQPVHIRDPKGDGSFGSWASCLVVPTGCVAAGGALVGRRKYRAQVDRTLEHIEPHARQLAEATADVALDARLETLPGRLAALWDEGRPLEGGERLERPAERRAALQAFWQSRTCNRWGQEVRDLVEHFIETEIQPGPHPFPDDQLEALSDHHRCGP